MDQKGRACDRGPCPEGLETYTAAVMTADILGTHAKGWTRFQALFNVVCSSNSQPSEVTVSLSMFHD